MIQIDSREKQQELLRITRQFNKLDVDYFVKKLDVGDYMKVGNEHLSIDRKKNLQELCGNVTQQHERFQKELLRANKTGVKLVILCEHGDDITCLEDVFSGLIQGLRYHPERPQENSFINRYQQSRKDTA